MNSTTSPTSANVMRASSAEKPRWEHIDVVLLDMDGTLLDLRFDNYFWQELVPERYALLHSIDVDAALQALRPRFQAKQGTLDWYCTDFWSRELGMDIAALKHEIREQVCFLPGADEFLNELGRRDLRRILVTNAHQDSLAVKARQTGLTRHFDAVVSSHQYGAPKEHADFWARLETQMKFDPERCLFVDDSLPVLRAARRHGIGQIFAVSRPDSGADQRIIEEFPSVPGVIELVK